MTIQKIKSGRVTSVVADVFVGDKGQIFYNEDLGDLRLSDGISPGGIPLMLGGGGSGNYSTILSATPPGAATAGTLWWDTDDSKLYVRYNNTWNLTSTSTTVPIATTNSTGVVKIGTGLVVAPDGKLSVDPTLVVPSSIAIKHTGTVLTTHATSINFTGSGVTTSSTNGDVTVQIEGGTGGGLYGINLDGGHPDSIYGGVNPIDGGYI